jgi:hypothetical protein
MIRMTAIAVAITALLTITAGLLASSATRVLFAHHEQWWWPLMLDGLASVGWITPLLSVGIAAGIVVRQQRLRGRQH